MLVNLCEISWLGVALIRGHIIAKQPKRKIKHVFVDIMFKRSLTNVIGKGNVGKVAFRVGVKGTFRKGYGFLNGAYNM